MSRSTPRTLVIGTTNRGKVRQMRGALATLPLHLVPIDEVLTTVPDVVEIGHSAEEVAAKKAIEYSMALGDTVLSLDHWLYLDGVSEELQPGPNVRRIPGHRHGATDEELLDYYSRLAAAHGGRLRASWDLGVAIASGTSVRATTIVAARELVAAPSAIRLPGLPLSSLQIDLTTGRYVSEHESEDEIALWQRVYGSAICRFVTDALEETGG